MLIGIGANVWVDGTGTYQVVGTSVGITLFGTMTEVLPGIGMKLEIGKVDGNKVGGITTGDGPYEAGIGMLFGTGGGVGMVMMTDDGTDDGRNGLGMMMFPLDKMKTQAVCGA